MPITVKHTKVSTIPDADDDALVRPSDWNADHTLIGLGTMAEQNANNVNITGGTITGVAGFGDVVGPASATDNAVARYDTTTGKLIQNSLVIVDDAGSVTGVNALTAQSLTVNNNATLGSSNTDSIDVRGRISSDLDPETNNAKDIGTNGRNWRDGFFGRTLHTVNLELTGTTSFDGSEGTSGQVLTSQGVGNTPIWATSGGGISTANIQEFTASGTSTWTKPAGAKLVYIVCQGAGGGGGSGYKQIAVPTNAAISGGNGGGTGGWSELMIPAALLGSTETVTTGVGGTGGASVTVTGGSNNGTAGGDSSFGSWCVARGGLNGAGGSTGTSGSGGGSTNNSNFVSIIVGTTVLSGNTTVATRGSSGATAIKGGKSGGGGAAGGGIVVATAAALSGGVGGEGGAGVKSTNTATTGGGGTAGTTGSPNAGAGSNSTNYYIGGNGGGGGASQITANGGNGGNGGNSAGGGGGGACQNAFNSGAGGNGGDGSVMVITFF